MNIRIVVSASILLTLVPRMTSQAAVPTQISVQGKLTNSSNVPRTGSFTFTFEIYNAESSGFKVWPPVGVESQVITTNADGVWTAQLGAVVSLSDGVFSNEERWLQVTVSDGVLPPDVLPRVKLNTSPYSYRISTVDGASGGTITSKVSIGQGHTNTGDDAFIAGSAFATSVLARPPQTPPIRNRWAV